MLGELRRQTRVAVVRMWFRSPRKEPCELVGLSNAAGYLELTVYPTNDFAGRVRLTTYTTVTGYLAEERIHDSGGRRLIDLILSSPSG